MGSTGTREQRTPTRVHEPLAPCPRCQVGRLRAMGGADGVCFECDTCAARWRQELGYIWPVV